MGFNSAFKGLSCPVATHRHNMHCQARKIRDAFAKNICKENGCEFSSRLSVCLSASIFGQQHVNRWQIYTNLFFFRENLYIQIYRQQNRLITEQQVNEANPLYDLAQLPQNRNDSTHPDTTPTSTAQAHTYR